MDTFKVDKICDAIVKVANAIEKIASAMNDFNNLFRYKSF